MTNDLYFRVPGDQLFRVAPFGDGWSWTCVTDECMSISRYVDYETADEARGDALEHLAKNHGLRPDITHG